MYILCSETGPPHPDAAGCNPGPPRRRRRQRADTATRTEAIQRAPRMRAAGNLRPRRRPGNAAGRPRRWEKYKNKSSGENFVSPFNIMPTAARRPRRIFRPRVPASFAAVFRGGTTPPGVGRRDGGFPARRRRWRWLGCGRGPGKADRRVDGRGRIVCVYIYIYIYIGYVGDGERDALYVYIYIGDVPASERVTVGVRGEGGGGAD